MNILYYLEQFPAIGGIETVTATLANVFVTRGYEIIIVSHADKGVLGAGIWLDDRVSVLHMPDEACFTPRNREFLQQTIRERKIDIVVFQDSYAGIERNLFPVDGAVKVVTVEHNAPQFISDPSAKYALIRRMLWRIRHPFWKTRQKFHDHCRRRFLYANSDRYVLLSNQFYGEFRTITGMTDSRKLRAIPNPLAMVASKAACEKQNEIVFCATLNGLKGCDLLLQVWQKIQAKCPGWSLTIVGDGPDRALLEKMRGDLKLERCAFEGYRTDPTPYFARAKIFAFPSRREGWGLVLVEAMANGCVPVAFDSYGAVHDIIDDELNGFVVPAFDLDRFSRALLKLTENDECVRSMSEQAKRKAADFDVEEIADKWESLIADIP